MTPQELKEYIAQNIHDNTEGEITGDKLQEVLNKIVDNIPASQVNSDWNATEGPAEILNKPTIPEGALIVDATDNGETFAVNNELTIVNAGASGRVVMLRYNNSGSVAYAQVIHFGIGGGCLAAKYVSGKPAFARIVD